MVTEKELERRKKISLAKKGKPGRKQSIDIRKKISEGLKNIYESGDRKKIYRKKTQEEKDKISNTMKGVPKKPFTDEHRKNIGLSSKGRQCWAKGKKMSDTFKDKCRKRMMGIKLSPETIKKRTLKVLGRKTSEETKEKLRVSAINRIERKLKLDGKLIFTMSIYETPILDKLETALGFKIIRQYKVAGYFLDGYCPEIRLAIEIDEPYHLKEKQMIKDKRREIYIKDKLKCNFLRIPVVV